MFARFRQVPGIYSTLSPVEEKFRIGLRPRSPRMHTTPKDLRSATITDGHFGIVFEENSIRENKGFS